MHFDFQYIYPISYKIAKKGKPDEMDLPLLKNDITNNLRSQKPVVYSRYQRFGVDDFMSKSSKIWPSNFDAEYRDLNTGSTNSNKSNR
jgi:hypothetical protein